MTPDQNKAVVVRFNKECIEQGSIESFKELLAEDVVNRTAPPGVSPGKDGMIQFLRALKGGFPDLKVDILEQIAERDLVTTRKQIRGTHTGEFMGISATNKKVAINVIDIIRVRDGKYAEHWGMSNLSDVMGQLAKE